MQMILWTATLAMSTILTKAAGDSTGQHSHDRHGGSATGVRPGRPACLASRASLTG